MTKSYVDGRDLAGKLEALLGSSASLMILAYEQKEEIRETLTLIERLTKGPPPREVALRYMAEVSNAQLRRDLREARGERSAANFRTRLTHDLAARSGNGAARAI